MTSAFQYVINNGGIATEASYPYTGNAGNCDTKVPLAVKISSYANVTVNSSVALETALATQPVSVAVDGSSYSFMFYTGGILPASQCGNTPSNGLLAVGYGTQSGTQFYKVKNSWGIE